MPGDNVAGVTLGSTFAAFQATFPSHTGIDVDAQKSAGFPCPTRTYQWVDVDKNARGVSALFRGSQIFQMSIQTPRFALASGVHMDSPAEDVKIAYPAGQEYVLIGSGKSLPGGNDLVYWVDSANGIAFQLYWNADRKARLLGGVDIFVRGDDYLPGGCLMDSLSWNQVR